MEFCRFIHTERLATKPLSNIIRQIRTANNATRSLLVVEVEGERKKKNIQFVAEANLREEEENIYPPRREPRQRP